MNKSAGQLGHAIADKGDSLQSWFRLCSVLTDTCRGRQVNALRHVLIRHLQYQYRRRRFHYSTWVDTNLSQLLSSNQPQSRASWLLRSKACCGMPGSCGRPDIWAEELPVKGQAAMAISLQAETLAATAKVCAPSLLCTALLTKPV